MATESHGQHELATRLLGEALARDPLQVAAWHYSAFAAMRLTDAQFPSALGVPLAQRSAEVVRRLERAVSIDPGWKEGASRQILAVAQTRLRQFERDRAGQGEPGKGAAAPKGKAGTKRAAGGGLARTKRKKARARSV